ncbi:hypothetical protein LLG95_00530 [bacterium]|nr:hypothetical protein [bacterium]
MAQYIGDPEIARAIDDLKTWWPAIGEAADHPLTEWFIRHQSNKQRTDWSRYSALLARILVYLIALSTLYWFLPRYLHGLIYVAGSIVGAIERRIIIRRKQSNIRNLRHLLLREGDAGQLEQLWLTPITYRDCAGIHLGCIYDHIFNPRVRIVRRIVFWGLILALVWVFNRIINSSSASVPNMIAAWICLIVFGASVCFSLSIPAFMLHSALQQIRVERLRQKALLDETVLDSRNSVIVAYLIGAMIIAIILMLVAPLYWFVLDFILLASGLSIYGWARSMQTRELDRYFNEFVETESSSYNELVSRLMNRDKSGIACTDQK